jgi:M6 family metalloprotease-like protein
MNGTLRVIGTITQRRRTLACALAVLVAALVGAGQVAASPADPNSIVKLRQPDGRSFLAHIWGDEFIHGYEALNGHTVVLDERTKTWTYARRGVRGTLRPSDAVVTRDRPLARKHLRPTPRAFDRSRAREGVPPLGKPLILAAPSWAGADTDVLFVMVEFSDLQCTFTPAQMQTNMFGGGASGPGDLDDYYDEISYGELELVGQVVGDNGGTADCVNLPNNRAFYNDDGSNADGDDDLVRAAIADIDAGVNFADYDNNNDGTIDALGIIYAGGGAHDGCATGTNDDNLWPHSGSIADPGPTVTADGKTVSPFILNSELTFDLDNRPPPITDCDQIQTIGLFAHELGHSLGLPDLYDEDIGTGGVSFWSAMASQYLGTEDAADTPPHFDPWSKAFMGWVDPTEHAAGDRFVTAIPRVEGTSGVVHQFLSNPGGFEEGGSGEYFLVENRQQTGFDAQLPGCGIVVWHIDEAQDDNKSGGHTAASHRLVDVEEADGLAELDQNSDPDPDVADDLDADAGDPFPGSTNNRLLDGTTNPSSDLYNGSNSGVRMWVQSTGCGASMTAAFGPNAPPTASAGGPYSTNEGTDVTLTAAGSTDPDGDALTYAWDLDNDGAYDDSTSQTPTFTNVGDNGAFTVKVTVTDSFGSSSATAATVTVSNVRPEVTLLSNDGPELEGGAVSISGTIADPGWLDTLTATVDWGDGGGPQSLAGAPENTRPDATLTFTSVAHTYGDDGVFSVTVCANDDDGASTVPCQVTMVTISNANPTAVIDLVGTVSINGVSTFVAHEGQVIPFSGGSFDPGSDDRTTTWDWGDGAPSPDTSALSLNDTAFNPDPDPSPSVNARTVVDPEPHAFGSACFYTVTFGARDDDAGSASAQVAVIIAGNASLQRGAGYWQTQYQPRPTSLSEARRQCYLAIVRFMSSIFDEATPLATVAQAFSLLKISNNTGSETQKLERELLTAWLNFANGAFDLNELVDTDGNRVADTPFATVMANAEAVRTGPSTDAQKIAQRDILQRINGS